MDAVRIAEVIKELVKLLQNTSEFGRDDDIEIVKRVELEVEEIKEELGSWFMNDFEIYQAS
jgi:hypothetical protein